MKKLLSIIFTSSLMLTVTQAQALFTFTPVPVTNGMTDMPVDDSIAGALFYQPGTATSENSLIQLGASVLLPYSQAEFPPASILAPGGGPITFQVRAWSAEYASYQAAMASGLSSVLAGKSALYVYPGYSGPTPPGPTVTIPGFSIYAVPEPSVACLGMLGLVLAGRYRRLRR